MDVRTPFFQNIACVLIGVLFLNPIVTTAAELALDAQSGSNAAVTQAANGVPMVNIATPNGSGLSHNKFTDFNVSQQGLILNNSAQAVVQTQLGGYVMGNPNLTGGAANVILNEVNGGSPSQLKGYTEVAGKSAAVIVANPHGISCDGCGFINTPRVTLSTGKPVVEGGRLDRFDVDGGQISIEGDGLNARNVSQFDLITRSAQINAELHANQLNVITGRNDVDAANLSATAKADDGSAKPQLAIDSSALGGMYAGAIRLVGTEAGVGVKLAGDMAASAGDIQIDANGQLSMARTAASRDLQLKAENIELNADTFAGRNAVVDASGQTLVKESLAATQQLTVKGGELLNQGVVEAGVRADGSLNNTATLSLQTSTVTNPGTITSHGNLNSDVQTLDNRAGKLLSAGDATLNAQTLDNQGGRIVAQKDLELSGNQLNNQSGEVLAQQTIKVTAANLDNQDGAVAGDALDLQLSANLNNQNGLVESASDLQLAANTLSNNGGKLRALGGEGESRFVLGGLFNNDAGLVEIGSGAFALSSVGLSNLGGTVRHVGDQGFAIDLTALGQAGGRFITNGAVDLSLDEWSNISSLQAKTLNISINRLTQSATGALLAVDGITTSGERWENHGRIETDGALHLTLSDAYTGNGKLLAQSDLSLTANSADLGSDAELRSAGGVQIDISAGLSSAGKITSANDLSVKAASLNNQGTLGSAAALHIEAAQLINQGGLLFSGGGMQLLADRISNLYADIYSLGTLTIAKDGAGNKSTLLENRSGSIESSGDMSLRATTLTNRKEVFTPGKQLTAGSISVVCYDCSGDHHNVDYVATERFNITVDQDSAASRIHSGGNLTIQGDAIANRYSSLSASGNINITGITLENMGAASGIIERIRRFNTGRVTDGTDERFRDNHINPYNAAALPKEVPSALYAWTLTSDIETQAPNGSGAPAIIQAGGNVSIQATQSLTNSSVLNNQAAQAGTAPGLDTTVTGSSQPLVVQLNAQLPADSQQLVVDPLALPGFALPQGQNGLFQLNNDPGYPYLIETNPAFASLSNFLNSGYLLNAVGYNPDQTQRRLGDGLYEQRLIQQAIAARTGKRFLAGLNSDEAQFKYLMDNAIASKQALNLAPGIALTAEQVAALTHDIVWMQEQVVNGQKVLVPVLYLAQANDRLAPGGALIQGQDVALISGSNLNNSGTLRASNNLSVTANNIGNSGLMQAGERASLLATGSIRNTQGGLINGKDISAIALTGDIINERSITHESRSGRSFSQLTSVVDKAAGIEASNNLTLSAGRNIQNIGGSLKAGGDATLSAGHDVVIASAAAESGSMRKDKRHFWEKTSTTQYGSDVHVGGDLDVKASNDITVVASTIKAGGDIAFEAGNDVTIASAANESSSEYRYKGNGKKINKEDSSVRQQASLIEAGGDLDITADNNLIVSASQLEAGDEAYLYAGDQLALLSAENSDYSLYDMKKKGSWGSKEAKRDEITDVRNIGSTITTGGDLTLESGGDQLYRKATLDSGGDLTLDSGGAITFEAVKDMHQESHDESSSSWVWTSMDSKGKVDETLRQSQLTAKGEVLISAVDGLHIDVKQVNQQTVSQSIDAMVQADPSMAWLKEVEARGDVDWRQVREVHDQWSESHSGLGGPAMIIIAIIVTYFTAGAASGLVGSAAGATAGSGTAFAAGTAATAATTTTAATAATAAGWANVAATAVLTSAASTATISTINNKGDVGAALEETFNSDNLKNYLVAGATAGLTAGLYSEWTGTKTGGSPALTDSTSGALANGGKVAVSNSGGLSSWQGIGQFAANQALQNTTSAVLNKALGRDGSLGDALQSSLANTFAAFGFNLVGDIGQINNLQGGGLTKIGLHAVMGGLAAEAAGGDFKTGALAAGINEALINHLATQYADMPKEKRDALLAMNSQLIGVLSTAIQDPDADAEKLQTGSWVAQYSTQYNRQLHEAEEKWLRENAKKFAKEQGVSEQVAIERLSQQALKDVDYLWRSLLSDGDDSAAKQFLSSSEQTFINDAGKQQALFTAEGQQLFRPEMFADTADPQFYRQFVQSGISRDLSSGLIKEMKDSGIALKDGAVDLLKATVDHPGAVLDGLWNGISEIPQGIVDGFKESGRSIGEGAAVSFDENIQAQLNAIYGADVSTAQEALLLLRTVSAIGGASAVGKTGGKVTGKVAEAVSKKLDEILSEAAEKALIKSGGIVGADGKPVLDLKQLTNEQKGILGDLFGSDTVKQIIPDGEKLARIPGVGETGIDDLYKVNRADVDYVVIEYKFVGTDGKTGSSALGNTADGKQGSDGWILGGDRLERAVSSERVANSVRSSIDSGRIETWVVTTRRDGATEIQVLDSIGKAKLIDTSKLLSSGRNLLGVQP
jgi:filamentous hemagglutinin